jgi:putative FmdB family regulatory protein
VPTYEYICEKCGHTFEKSQSIAAKPLRVCLAEVCPLKRWGKGKVKRTISGGANLIFKGSGFYITDHRSEQYKQAASKEAAPATAAGGESKSSPQTKPAAKPKSKPNSTAKAA